MVDSKKDIKEDEMEGFNFKDFSNTDFKGSKFEKEMIIAINLEEERMMNEKKELSNNTTHQGD